MNRATAVFSASFLTVLAAYAIRYAYGTLLPEMLPVLAITKAQAGIGYAAYFIAYTLFSPLVGRMADRYDMRVIISAFMAVMGLGAFLMQYAANLWQLCIFFGITGLGCSACWAPVMALNQRWTSDRRRGFSLAMVDAGSTIGVMAAGALVPLLVSIADWRLSWRVLGGCGLALALMNYILIRDRPAVERRPAHPAQTAPITYRQLLADRQFWYIGLAYLLVGVTIQIPFTFLSTYVVQELAVSYHTAAQLITVIGIAGLLGKLALGPLSDKIGRIRIMIISASLTVIGCLGIAACQGWPLFAATFIFGIGYGACWSMYAACAGDFFVGSSSGAIIGLWTVYLGVGLIVAPVIAGWVGDLSGTLMWGFVISAAAGLGTIVLLWPLLRLTKRT